MTTMHRCPNYFCSLTIFESPPDLLTVMQKLGSRVFFNSLKPKRDRWEAADRQMFSTYSMELRVYPTANVGRLRPSTGFLLEMRATFCPIRCQGPGSALCTRPEISTRNF